MVWALVVTYNPRKDMFLRLLEAVVPQVEGIVVVDDGSSSDTLCWLALLQPPCSYRFISLKKNQGIAAAQNAGIAYLRNIARGRTT
jgi:rhamnosyltransferase